MEAYISKITFELNGQVIEDFNAFSEKERVFKRPVNLMNRTGVSRVTARHGFSLDYVVPADKPETDFEGVEEGTATIEYENGKRISFGGVHCLSIGEGKFDGEKEVVKTIEFIAETRNEE